jgi:hypothetical protein
VLWARFPVAWPPVLGHISCPQRSETKLDGVRIKKFPVGAIFAAHVGDDERQLGLQRQADPSPRRDRARPHAVIRGAHVSSAPGSHPRDACIFPGAAASEAGCIGKSTGF